MDEKVTIKDIAQMAKTSKTTVSFYLNGKYDKMSEKTREKIEKVIKDTNYKPSIAARGLNSKNTKLIGVLIGDITNSFSNQIVKGIEESASKKDYQVIIGNSNYLQDREDYYIENMERLGVDGFIIQPTAQFRKYIKTDEKVNKPMVFFDSRLYDYRSSWVKTNNYDATYDAILSCIKKGYQRFLLIGADPSLLSTRIERVTGFVDALLEHNYTYDNLILNNDEHDFNRIKQFLNRNLLDFKENTLIFVPNCWALPIVFTAMKEYKHLMPSLGLIGFDNTEWTNFASPTITTIVQPAFQEGQEASEILINKIEEKQTGEQHSVLDCVINWNDSTDLKV